MSLRQIEYFVAAAKAGSLSAGARRSNVSQPSLCVQIRQLEQRVGASLLWRHSQGVELTAAGKVFLPHAIAALRELRQAERAVASLEANVKEIWLGIMPTPGRALVVDLLRKCKEALTSHKLQFREGLSDEMWQLFADGELDAAFCYDPVAVKTGSIVSLYREEFFLVGSPQILKPAGDLNCAALGKFRLVLGNRKHSMRKFIDSTLAADAIDLDVVFEIEPMNLKREMLIRQGCCSIVPYGLFWDEIRSGELCARRIKPRLSRTVGLLLHDSLSTKTGELLVSLIRSVVKTRIEEGELGWRAI